ncbi:C40 family peptidase [Chitinibacter sp. S2-10]|uniref:C40 family peptidase n=1 Tax=Chitinibacter sp. S2-10 TaxID=3373597 RepID=UPI003977A47C
MQPSQKEASKAIPIRSPVVKSFSSQAAITQNMESDAGAREVIMVALGLLDIGYRLGGSQPEEGLDCSGLVKYVYKNAVQLDLPRTSIEMALATRPIEKSDLKPGDLVFFNTQGRPYSHVGIYLGNGRFIHAPSAKGKVRIESINNSYFGPRFEGARSLLAQK